MIDPLVVTRFAPSPTGFLHIGGVRTALFNWLFARHHGGRFLLRVEDTDRKRTTSEATEAIFTGMRWMGLNWNGEPVSQFSRRDRHVEVAHAMLETGAAYRCHATQEDIAAFRQQAKAEGRSTLFHSPWRERSGRPDAPHVIRLKAPRNVDTTIRDAVQGKVTWRADQLDDLILMRSDGTPTYMLAVVVDDHDMGVTNVIRGDDHLTNAARQNLIFQANGWKAPVFAHIPLIHGTDGAKLSKRHGALGIEAYRDMGFLPEAMRNYLVRLGWSHGNNEFFTTEQAVEWFDLDAIGKSPARFDLTKLKALNGQHMRAAENASLLKTVKKFAVQQNIPLPKGEKSDQLERAIPILKKRTKTLIELIDTAYFILKNRPIQYDEKSQDIITPNACSLIAELMIRLQKPGNWDKLRIEGILRNFVEERELAFTEIAQPLRTSLIGGDANLGVFDVMSILGKDETLARLGDLLRN